MNIIYWHKQKQTSPGHHSIAQGVCGIFDGRRQCIHRRLRHVHHGVAHHHGRVAHVRPNSETHRGDALSDVFESVSHSISKGFKPIGDVAEELR